MKSLKDDIKKIVTQFNIKPRPDMRSKVLDEALELQRNQNQRSTSGTYTWRIIMKNKITKYAAVAVIIIAGIIGINQFGGSVDISTTAYAIEQSVEAMKDIRNFHFYHITPDGNMTKESWVQYDTDGYIKNSRVNYSFSKYDMVAVWKDGVLKQWREDNNSLEIIENELVSEWCVGYTQRYNPRSAVEYLNEHQEYIDVQIDESSDTGEPTIITAIYDPNTFLTGGDACPQVRQIFYVDNTTKFISSIETYMPTKTGAYNLIDTIVYCDYNQPVSYDFFTLENELSEDYEIIDRRKMSNFGLSQGNFTKEQIAEKLVKELLEALIENDHEKAYMFFLGHPENKDDIQETLDRLDVVKIVSVGPITKPGPYSKKMSHNQIVPLAFENTKGEIINQKAVIRRSFSGVNRWIISEISDQ
jgi:hypothetical protein